MSTLNYAKGQPVGNNNVPMFDAPPAVKAIARYGVSNGSASSVITLTHNTTAIEIATEGGGEIGAVMRWVATSDTQASVVAIGANANYDHVVSSHSMRRFVVPIEAIPTSAASVQGANRANGLYQRVAVMTDGVASVYVAEYGSSNSY